MSVAAPWTGLPADVQAEFTAHGRRLELKRRQIVYDHGETPTGIYWVVSGLVGVVILGRSGTEHLLRFFRPGQVFGHRALFAEENYHGRTLVLEECELAFVPKALVLAALERHPVIYQAVIRQLSKELRRAELHWVETLEHEVTARVAGALIYLQAIDPEHPWTRQEIANFCASTVATVIRALKLLEAQGLVRQDGRRLAIADRERLLALAHED
ncbi:MAG: Crp/Fnr family transcriptional regulator [Gammaproteobacteria bacterium]|nr:Crp/Fnr family transcriptional regulator [Gammaproteobacteria bacterium]MBI5616041.1 Crp/Fnr family transcriptional regulator [Gammaproteobacteria bacterium]